ncbi:DUF1566 domain-containing protein [Candidatus Dojkabacteria bacterium]|uniref:DUF1566 domain-containing protein n=1 Tax=Candidatus Dojkabacteria bacterium TaxID=2099670 RepID=A0A847ET36_9BACT|nr:DUF1566 domain-containing protein [Candidatus Dojkabacteria bacterium]
MNKILTFLLGVILTIGVIFLFFRPNKEVNVSELEGDVRGIYSKLVELGYTQDLTEDDIQLVVEKIQESSNWIPQGTVTSNDVVEGKTFYNRSREIQTGTYKSEEFDFLGNANQSDVIEGKQFYSNAKELLTGTLKIPVVTSTIYKGDALVTDVMSGKKFYSNSGILLTGTYTIPTVSYMGDAEVLDVMSGKKFYSNSGTLLTGTWSFLGDAVVDEVLDGKKFYSNSGTLLTGTYTPPTPIDFTNMQYSTFDDYAGIDYLGYDGTLTEDYKGEEAQWSKISNNIWKDERAGIYWSSDQTLTMRALVPNSNSNIFTAMSLNTCDYFNAVPRSSYDGSDLDCGNAINWCATLTLDGRSNWYLPSQKELMLAYIDGMYNQAGDTLQEAAEFTVGDGSAVHYGNYWSSSEVSNDSTSAFYVYLYGGDSNRDPKANTYSGVRCVSRD